MIPDREMRALFGAESEEHLQRLDEGLLRLENAPDDRATLENVFRHAHSLKGAARMLGLWEIETLAHAFEEALGKARADQTLGSEAVERLLGALDGLKALVAQAVSDRSASVDVNALLRSLGKEPDENTAPSSSNAAPSSLNAVPSTNGSAPVEVTLQNTVAPPSQGATNGQGHAPSAPAIAPAASTIAPSTFTAAPDASWSIETIRVEPAKLDSLLSMAGELVVSTTRAKRGQSELLALAELREEWSRASSAALRALRELAGVEPERAQHEMKKIIEGQAERVERFGRLLDRFASANGDLDRLASVVTEMEASIRGVRLLPLSTLFGLFPRSVRDLSRASGKPVRLEVEGGDTHADKLILESLKDPLMHLIRNAIDHGFESPAEREETGKPATATLRLRGYNTAHQVVVEVEDDGRGLDADAIRKSAARKGLASEAELAAMTTRDVFELIFTPGFSTKTQVSELSGRGVGLDIVRANVAKLRGTVEVESRPGQGCLFRLSLPVTLATTRVLLVRAGEQTFGVPIEAVRGLFTARPDDVYRFGGREAVSWNGRPIAVARLGDVLGVGRASRGAAPCLVLEAGDECVGLLLDALLEEQEIILKQLGPLARRVSHFAGATILETGEVCLVVHPGEIVRRAARGHSPALATEDVEPPAPPKSVLLVEDSITVRTQEKRILESAGYEVTLAFDGLDAWGKLGGRSFDAVVTDIEMPRLSGLELTQRIREEERFVEMPVILVTSLGSEDDRRRGADAGANAYIVKSAFDQRTLLDALRRLA